MNRFWEKCVTDERIYWNSQFLAILGHFWSKITKTRIFQNMGPTVFESPYSPLTSCTKPEKNNEQILRKVRHRRTDLLKQSIIGYFGALLVQNHRNENFPEYGSNCFWKITIWSSLLRHFQPKLMIQFWEKVQKVYFWAILGTFGPKWPKWAFFRKIGLCQFLAPMDP